MWVWHLDRYETLFGGASAEAAIGQGTARGICTSRPRPGASNTTWATLGLVAVLARNPIDRAYSAYTMLLGDGREAFFDFAHALAAEPERTRLNWDPLFRYVDMGFYARQLSIYRELFPPHQLRVYLYDDFNARPKDVLQDIFRFLDVDDTFVPDTSGRHNVSMVPRSHALRAGSSPVTIRSSRHSSVHCPRASDDG